MPRLEGKTALVTGGGLSAGDGGTGHATAVMFAREGAHVFIVDRDHQHAMRTVDRISSEDGKAQAIQADITSESACRAVVDQAVAETGRIDILDNNVGTVLGGTVVDVSEQDWDRIFAVNVKSILLLSKYVVPVMAGAGGGSIINISSINPRRPYRSTPYAATKAAVEAMTRGMAIDHGEDGIRVNCIAPGPLATHRVNHLDEQYREMRRLASPLQIEGRSWDIGHAAVFLASDESAYITGETLTVDGGVSITGPRYR